MAVVSCREKIGDDIFIDRSDTELMSTSASKIQRAWKESKVVQSMRNVLILPSQISDSHAFTMLNGFLLANLRSEDMMAFIVCLCRKINELVVRDEVDGEFDIQRGTLVCHSDLKKGRYLALHLLGRINFSLKQVEILIENQRELKKGGYKKVFFSFFFSYIIRIS